AAARPRPHGGGVDRDDRDPVADPRGLLPPARAAEGGTMRRALPWTVALALCRFALFPLAWIVFSSLQSYADLYRFPPTYAPQNLSLGFYAKVLETTPFTTFMVNSVIVGSVATLAGVAVAAMAGYALARARFRGRGLLLKSVLLAYMFPQILI